MPLFRVGEYCTLQKVQSQNAVVPGFLELLIYERGIKHHRVYWVSLLPGGGGGGLKIRSGDSKILRQTFPPLGEI